MLTFREVAIPICVAFVYVLYFREHNLDSFGWRGFVKLVDGKNTTSPNDELIEFSLVDVVLGSTD